MGDSLFVTRFRPFIFYFSICVRNGSVVNVTPFRKLDSTNNLYTNLTKTYLSVGIGSDTSVSSERFLFYQS